MTRRGSGWIEGGIKPIACIFPPPIRDDEERTQTFNLLKELVNFGKDGWGRSRHIPTALQDWGHSHVGTKNRALPGAPCWGGGPSDPR